MRFGFSYVGLIYLLMLFVPNIIWAKNKPKDYEKYVSGENKILGAFERAGEILASVFAVIFCDFNLRPLTPWTLWLLASFLLMIFYELYWIRYFKSPKTMRDQYKKFLFFPVTGASLPVLAFFLLGIYGTNILMVCASIILGIGHIGIHLAHQKEAFGPAQKRRLVVKIFRGVGIAILALLFVPLVVAIGVRNAKYARHYANFWGGVDEQVYINLGGQEQYLLVTGKSVSNPVIIYLHGGPAFSDVMAMSSYADFLMDSYTLIGWDQRGCGRTYYKNKNIDPQNQTATFDQTQKDLDQLVDWARKRFNQDKVIILAHSYGTIVGSQYALFHPEKVSAFVAVGQFVSLASGDELSYQDALKKAQAAGGDTSEMQKAHGAYMADKSLLNMLSVRAAVSKYHPVPKEANVAWKGLSSPYYGTLDMAWFMQMMAFDEYIQLNKQLFDYTLSFNAFEKETAYQMPVHFISGSEDWICPVALVEEYKENISAPAKTLTLLEGCGHSPQFDSPKEFAACVKAAIAIK